jgi:hypothetical protein
MSSKGNRGKSNEERAGHKSLARNDDKSTGREPDLEPRTTTDEGASTNRNQGIGHNPKR